MMSMSCALSESSRNASSMKEPSYMVPVDQVRTGFVVTEGIQKRFSFSVSDKCEDAISVYIRLKPKESIHKDNFLFYDEDKNTVTLKKKNVEQIYTFTHVFKPGTTQVEVYEMCAKPSLEKLLYGRNAFIFTYGASNSGKTFTIQGDKNNLGLIPRVLTTLLSSLKKFMDAQSSLVPEQGSAVVEMSDKEINEKESYKNKLLAMAKNLLPQITKSEGYIPFEEFERLGEEIENIEVPKDRGLYSVWLSFYEIYNEKVFDLFDGTKGPKKPLRLMTDIDSTIFVKGLRHIQVNTLHEAFLLYTFGRYNLSISSTGVNDRSSRSHSIFTIKIIGRPYHNSSSYFLSSSYSVCDLAGMERAHKTRNEGMRLREAQQINSSFLVLNKCLRIIRENQYCEIKKHVPYRESKLTQILGPALTSSNTALVMIVAVSQNDSFQDETEGTLKSSSVATSIKAITPPPRRVLKKTRFSMAISKCMPGRAVDWKEIASTLGTDNRNKDTNAVTGSCKNNCGLLKDMYPDGFKPDIYKELEEERNKRLAAEERICELERNYRQEMLNIEEHSSRYQSVKELEKKLEEQEEEYMTCLAENLKLKKTIRILKEEMNEKENKIKELESTCNTFEEMLDDAKEEAEYKEEEVKELQGMIETRDRMIVLKDEKIESLEQEKMNLEDNLIANSNEYESQLMSLEEELQNKQLAYDELFSKYQVVTKELHETQKKANDLENGKLTYFKQLQRILEENDGYKRHIDTLENQMQHFEENKQDLIRRYETLLEDKENVLKEKDKTEENKGKKAYALRHLKLPRAPKIFIEPSSDVDTPQKMTPENSRTRSEEKRFLSDFDTNDDPSFIPHNQKSRTSVKKKRTKARKNLNRNIPDYGDVSNAQSDATTSGPIDSSGRHRRKLFLRSSSDLAVCEDSSRMDDFNQTQASPATIVKRTLRTGKLY